MELSDSKDDSSKMTFDKDSSLMVDLLLDEGEYDDDTSAKLHAYVTGESMVVKQPPPVIVSSQPTDSAMFVISNNGQPELYDVASGTQSVGKSSADSGLYETAMPTLNGTMDMPKM